MHHQLDDCIFCQIAQGNAPASKIHEDELTLTMLDIFPATPGHVLIISKAHFDDIFTASPQVLAQIAINSSKIAKALQAVTQADGLGIYQLNKAAAGQTVFHYHMHLIPQFTNQNIGIHSKQAADPQQLEAMAQQLRQALNE
ncbi:HIT family protein [Oceanicoccus sp. KOV_DT_Chl]|uniref:HIT family protein n=1 Tax=Oceanicoccus sp. KOV_DT_Chl TaxID=1904639 RepID=UPI001F21F91E|nr:HIT family protein [Oceanicoccus sp. KOV_DT_Chl]